MLEEFISQIYINEQICLRLALKEDIEFMIDQEKQNSDYVSSWSFDYHLKKLTDPNVAQIIFTIEDKNIGYVILVGFQDSNNSMELTRIVVAEPFTKNGYGSLILDAVQKLCFNIINFNRLWLDVVDYNERALNLYLRAGFVLEGTLRESDFYKGSYNDMHILAIIKSDYTKIQKTVN